MLDRLALLPGSQRDAMSTAFGMADGPPPDRFLIGLAALSLLSQAAEQAPLLCAVDDARLLDQSSAQALTFVARRLRADPVCLLFGSRHPIEDLRGFSELNLQGLDASDARALLALVLRAPLDARVRERIIAETHGNPLALLEWPRGLTPAELAGGFGLPALPMAGRIEERFRRRLEELLPAAQRFLTVAAAEPTGDPTLVWRAARRIGVSSEEVSTAVESGLIDIGARTSFRHPLVRSVAYAAASRDERRTAHAALAEVTDAIADRDLRAWHLALAAAGSDEEDCGLGSQHGGGIGDVYQDQAPGDRVIRSTGGGLGNVTDRELDVRQFAIVGTPGRVGDGLRGLIDADHAAVGADQLGRDERHVARARTHVEHAHTRPHTGCGQQGPGGRGKEPAL
jgi:hypothetical protein